MVPTPPVRSHLRITVSVWRALFLREALARLFSARAAWFWLILEPVFNVAILILIFSAIRVHSVGGLDTSTWLMVGMLAFFMFRRTAGQVTNGVNANQALFAYRQVKPGDTVLVRGLVEGFLMVMVIIFTLALGALLGHTVVPADLLAVILAFFGLWLLGLGYGLVSAVATELLPELGRVLNLLMTPLYFASGVMAPLSVVPPPYRDWLLLNPVVHGVEAARLGFVAHYHVVQGVELDYLYACAIVTIFFGLALLRRFERKLVTL